MNRTQRRAEQRRNAKLARKAAVASPEPSHVLAAQPPTETAASSTVSQASEAQIAANRENATHSTGPRSE